MNWIDLKLYILEHLYHRPFEWFYFKVHDDDDDYYND